MLAGFRMGELLYNEFGVALILPPPCGRGRKLFWEYMLSLGKSEANLGLMVEERLAFIIAHTNLKSTRRLIIEDYQPL